MFVNLVLTPTPPPQDSACDGEDRVVGLTLRAILVARIEIAVQIVKVKCEERHIGAMACTFALDTFVVERVDCYATESDMLTTDQIAAIDERDIVVRALRLVV